MDAASGSFAGMNWLGMIVAIVFNIILGFVWYAPWFPTGKVWMREMKVPKNAKPTAGQMVKGLVLMVIGTFLLMFVFTHNFWVYFDAFSNEATGGDADYKLTVMDGLFGGLFTWAGFFLPQHLSGVAWENKSWSLFFVNTLYALITMVVAGILLVVVGDFDLPSA